MLKLHARAAMTQASVPRLPETAFYDRRLNARNRTP